MPDSSIAGVRAPVCGARRTAAETPGSARPLDDELYLDNELDLDKLLHTAAASSPPAAPSYGRAYRACREQSYDPVHRHQSARRRLLDLDLKWGRPPAPRGDAV